MRRKTHGCPVLILGAGRGGSALLEMFLDDDLVNVVGICDLDPAAPGLQIAARAGIPVFADAAAAFAASQGHPECIVYNLTHDDGVAESIAAGFGNRNVTSGAAAKLIWQMVTKLKRVKGELEASQGQLRAIISHAMDGIITTREDGTIEGFNPAAERIFGYAQAELLGRNVNVLMPQSEHSSHDGYLQRYVTTRQGRIIGVRGREVSAVRKNGEVFPMELSASEMELSGQHYFIGIVRDITERKHAEEKIARLAHHDYLTDLPNRALFLDRLDQAVSRARRGRGRAAVLFLDLDGFKSVNDRHGHDAGDQLLQQVAQRLRGVVRDSDTVARIGGDEFTFVLGECDGDAAVAAVAGKVLAVLAPPVVLGAGECRIGGSIGVAVYPEDGGSADELLRRSDAAMYAAKQAGKNTVRFAERHAAPAQGPHSP